MAFPLPPPPPVQPYTVSLYHHHEHSICLPFPSKPECCCGFRHALPVTLHARRAPSHPKKSLYGFGCSKTSSHLNAQLTLHLKLVVDLHRRIERCDPKRLYNTKRQSGSSAIYLLLSSCSIGPTSA